MAQDYTYTGPGTRYTVGNPTSKTYLDITRENVDYVYDVLVELFDVAAADGTFQYPIVMHKQTFAADFVIPVNRNGHSVGKVSVASGAKVTVPSTARWLIS